MTVYKCGSPETIERRCGNCGFLTRYPTINQEKIALKCYSCGHGNGIWKAEEVLRVKWVNRSLADKPESANPKLRTLGEWLCLAVEAFGEESKAVEFLNGKISNQGSESRVISDPAQFFALLAHQNQRQ